MFSCICGNRGLINETFFADQANVRRDDPCDAEEHPGILDSIRGFVEDK